MKKFRPKDSKRKVCPPDRFKAEGKQIATCCTSLQEPESPGHPACQCLIAKSCVLALSCLSAQQESTCLCAGSIVGDVDDEEAVQSPGGHSTEVRSSHTLCCDHTLLREVRIFSL